jgi:hypothetical protein
VWQFGRIFYFHRLVVASNFQGTGGNFSIILYFLHYYSATVFLLFMLFSLFLIIIKVATRKILPVKQRSFYFGVSPKQLVL